MRVGVAEVIEIAVAGAKELEPDRMVGMAPGAADHEMGVDPLVIHVAKASFGRVVIAPIGRPARPHKLPWPVNLRRAGSRFAQKPSVIYAEAGAFVLTAAEPVRMAVRRIEDLSRHVHPNGNALRLQIRNPPEDLR